jgi:hypothetical protein
MENDPELDGKYLGTISQDFAIVSDTLKEASYLIRKRGFSDLPIFPISKEDGIPIGQLLVDKHEVATAWNYNASFLEEFVQRKLIESDKVETFKTSFKDPDEFCCLFVIDGEFRRFVYIPYPVD